ncbi:MAG: ComEC/Rec2 family competence protein [Actinomycetota bacterium]
MRAWSLALGICVGVLLTPPLWMVALVAIPAMRFRRNSFVALMLAGLAIGGVRSHQTASPSTIIGELAATVTTCDLQGLVEPRSGSMGTFIEVRTLDCDGVVHRLGSMVVTEPTSIPSGSGLSATVRLSPLFDGSFDQALRRMGAEARAELLSEPQLTAPSGISAVAASVRNGVREASAVMDGDDAALLRGLVIGDTEGFSPEQEERFRDAGLAHLVAVSGSNVAIVTGALLLAFGRLPRIARYTIAALGLAVYVVVVGPEPSVLRATTMGAIGIWAALTGRLTESFAALGLAVGVVVAMRPDLLYSVGLHLSVAATTGIILWAAPIADRIPGPRIVALAAGVTVSAQIAVAPIIGAAFGVYSLAALPANLIAAGAVAPATVLGLAAGIVSLAVPPIGASIARLAVVPVAWINHVASAFGGAAWAEVGISPHAAAVTGVLCAMLVALSLRVRYQAVLDNLGG